MRQIIRAEQRTELARAWIARSPGESQEQFASRHGMSSRTLRNILLKYRTQRVPLEQARSIIRRAIGQLSTLLEDLAQGTGTDSDLEQGSPLPGSKGMRNELPEGKALDDRQVRSDESATAMWNW